MDDWKKYWGKFGVVALINAGVFTGYRLYIAHLKKLEEEQKKLKEAEKQKNENIKHVTPVGGNVFKDLGFEDKEAEELLVKAKKATRRRHNRSEEIWMDKNEISKVVEPSQKFLDKISHKKEASKKTTKSRKIEK